MDRFKFTKILFYVKKCTFVQVNIINQINRNQRRIDAISHGNERNFRIKLIAETGSCIYFARSIQNDKKPDQHQVTAASHTMLAINCPCLGAALDDKISYKTRHDSKPIEHNSNQRMQITFDKLHDWHRERQNYLPTQRGDNALMNILVSIIKGTVYHQKNVTEIPLSLIINCHICLANHKTTKYCHKIQPQQYTDT